MKIVYLILLGATVLPIYGMQLTDATKKRFDLNLKVLLRGREINQPDKTGVTPFMELFDATSPYLSNRVAVPLGEEKKFIDYAIHEYGAQINKSDNAGRTAICYAACNAWQMIPFLVECGADLNANDKGKSLYILDEMLITYKKYAGQMGVFTQFKESAELLLSKGCHAKKSSSFATANELANQCNFIEPLRHLLEIYADIEAGYHGIQSSSLSNTIYEVIKKRDETFAESIGQKDPRSYFARVPADVLNMVKNYSQFGRQNLKILESVAKYPIC